MNLDGGPSRPRSFHLVLEPGSLCLRWEEFWGAGEAEQDDVSEVPGLKQACGRGAVASSLTRRGRLGGQAFRGAAVSSVLRIKCFSCGT